MLKSSCQIDKIKSNVRFTGCTLLSCRVNCQTAITETHNRARASGKYQRSVTTTLANRPPPSPSYAIRRIPERFPCRGLQPSSYQAPGFDSDSCACQAFLPMCAAGLSTTCAVSGNPANGIPFFAYCAIESVQAVPKVSCVIHSSFKILKVHQRYKIKPATANCFAAGIRHTCTYTN